MRRDCPRIQRNQHADKAVETRPHCYRDDKSADDTELYVSMLVNGMPTRFLVDTGATVSLLSRTAYDRMDKAHETSTGVDGEVVSTNGTLVKVLGQTSVQLKISDGAWEQDVIIADIHEDGILGMDFLLKHKCIINLKTGAISIPGMEPIKMERTAGGHNQAMVRSVSMQPLSEAPVERTYAADEGLSAEPRKVQPKDKSQMSKFITNLTDRTDEYQDSTGSMQTKFTQTCRHTHSGICIPNRLDTDAKSVVGTDTSSQSWSLKCKRLKIQSVHGLETISRSETGIEHRTEKLYGGAFRLNRRPCEQYWFFGDWGKSDIGLRHASGESGRFDEFRLGKAAERHASVDELLGSLRQTICCILWVMQYHGCHVGKHALKLRQVFDP